MNNEQLAKIYANRLNKCLLAIKIFMISAMTAIAALVAFALIAICVNMQESNPQGVLLGIVVLGLFAAACVIGALSTLLTAKITMTKLKKLGADKS